MEATAAGNLFPPANHTSSFPILHKNVVTGGTFPTVAALYMTALFFCKAG
jgi:hypothetical protein